MINRIVDGNISNQLNGIVKSVDKMVYLRSVSDHQNSNSKNHVAENKVLPVGLVHSCSTWPEHAIWPIVSSM